MKNKKINILHLVTGLGMGGAEKVVLDLSKYTSVDKFNTYVVSLSRRAELYQEFLDNGINVKVLNMTNSLKDAFKILNILSNFVRKYNIDIIHAHMTHSIIVASILKLTNPSLKIVYTSHNIFIGSKLREFIVFLLKPLRNIDIVFSENILKYFYKSNFEVIPNGIKIDKYNLILPKNDIFTFIAVGRLETVKNHSFLIEIAKELKKEYEFEIHIVGEGYLKDELTALIDKYSLSSNIKLLGLRNDVDKLLNKSHCLIMPSLWEGLPIVILEAGAASLPIVSTNVGSIGSLLNDKNGYLCSLAEFKKTMKEVMDDYQKSIVKGKCLFENINENYSIEAVVSRHEAIYNNLNKEK